MGRPMPGWDVQILDEDERPVPQGERGEICLRARSNPHYPLGYWRNEEAAQGDVRRRLVPHQGRRAVRRGRLRLVRGPRRRRDHRRGLPDRPVRGRVRLPRARGGRGGGGGRVARRAARQRREGVHRARRGPRGLGRAGRRRSRSSCATRLSAYAYPRKIEFVDDLPKTLTGKIRRIELRQQEMESAQLSTAPVQERARTRSLPAVGGAAGRVRRAGVARRAAVAADDRGPQLRRGRCCGWPSRSPRAAPCSPCDRLPRRASRRRRCWSSRLLALLAALVVSGDLARPAAAAPLGRAASTGSAAARSRSARCGCPYDGADPWPRIVLELLARAAAARCC